jgi:hypothetical protein
MPVSGSVLGVELDGLFKGGNRCRTIFALQSRLTFFKFCVCPAGWRTVLVTLEPPVLTR